MTRRDKRKLQLGLIAFLAVGVFGSSAWLVIYDARAGRPAGTHQPGTDTPLLDPSPRDIEADVKRIRRAIEPDGFLGSTLARYHLRAGRFPTSLRDLMERPADLDPEIRWDGPYITNAEVLDDAWDQPYGYAYPGVRNPSGYDLWSLGPDGINGTADDISNW